MREGSIWSDRNPIIPVPNVARSQSPHSSGSPKTSNGSRAKSRQAGAGLAGCVSERMRRCPEDLRCRLCFPPSGRKSREGPNVLSALLYYGAFASLSIGPACRHQIQAFSKLRCPMWVILIVHIKCSPNMDNLRAQKSDEPHIRSYGRNLVNFRF